LKLAWRPMALDDRDRIMDYIAQDNIPAAIELDTLFEKKAHALTEHPNLFKTGRMKGTREAVVHPNYVMVYEVSDDLIAIVRVLHTSQEWGKSK
jgi:toxin ParE1/3/4